MLDKKEQDLDKPETNTGFWSFLNSFLANVLNIYCCTYNSDYHTNYNVHVIWTI